MEDSGENVGEWEKRLEIYGFLEEYAWKEDTRWTNHFEIECR